MIRFILKRKWRDAASGAEGSTHFTLDAVVPDLEDALSRGGFGEGAFDMTALIGVEVIVPIQTVPPRPDSPVTINLDAGCAAMRKTQQELLVHMWNTGHLVGTKCLYKDVANRTGKRACTTRSEAWLLGGHTAVVKVEFELPNGRAFDTVSLEHITLPNVEPPPGP